MGRPVAERSLKIDFSISFTLELLLERTWWKRLSSLELELRLMLVSNGHRLPLIGTRWSADRGTGEFSLVLLYFHGLLSFGLWQLYRRPLLLVTAV
jgi:hypothetical protein